MRQSSVLGESSAAGGALSFATMGAALTAHDLWPLVLKLEPAERIRLAKLCMNDAATGAADRAAYGAAPPAPDEFGSEGDPLAWDAEGWDEFHAPR
jgi:hypothetical protein